MQKSDKQISQVPSERDTRQNCTENDDDDDDGTSGLRLGTDRLCRCKCTCGALSNRAALPWSSLSTTNAATTATATSEQQLVGPQDDRSGHGRVAWDDNRLEWPEWRRQQCHSSASSPHQQEFARAANDYSKLVLTNFPAGPKSALPSSPSFTNNTFSGTCKAAAPAEALTICRDKLRVISSESACKNSSNSSSNNANNIVTFSSLASSSSLSSSVPVARVSASPSPLAINDTSEQLQNQAANLNDSRPRLSAAFGPPALNQVGGPGAIKMMSMNTVQEHERPAEQQATRLLLAPRLLSETLDARCCCRQCHPDNENYNCNHNDNNSSSHIELNEESSTRISHFRQASDSGINADNENYNATLRSIKNEPQRRQQQQQQSTAAPDLAPEPPLRARQHGQQNHEYHQHYPMTSRGYCRANTLADSDNHLGAQAALNRRCLSSLFDDQYCDAGSGNDADSGATKSTSRPGRVCSLRVRIRMPSTAPEMHSVHIERKPTVNYLERVAPPPQPPRPQSPPKPALHANWLR